MSRAPQRESAAVRRGRTVGLLVFGFLVVGFTAICSTEIVLQAWAAGRPAAGVDCRGGVLGLVRAVHRARAAAAGTTGGEREAIATFRRALEPEWSLRDGLGVECCKTPPYAHALEQLDRLRYAEEHALRYEALDVAGLRRSVEAIDRDLRRTP